MVQLSVWDVHLLNTFREFWAFPDCYPSVFYFLLCAQFNSSNRSLFGTQWGLKLSVAERYSWNFKYVLPYWHHNVYSQAQTYLKDVWWASVCSTISVNPEEWFTTIYSCIIAAISRDTNRMETIGRIPLAMLLPYSSLVVAFLYATVWGPRITFVHNFNSSLHFQLRSLITSLFQLRILQDPSFRQSKSGM